MFFIRTRIINTAFIKFDFNFYWLDFILFASSLSAFKRVTYWPQLLLGITFNVGVLIGFSSVTGNLNFSLLCLYSAGIFWTLGYDTIYAIQDIEDDLKIGIKSTALLFKNKVRMWIFFFLFFNVNNAFHFWFIVKYEFLLFLGFVFLLGYYYIDK